MMSRMVQKFPSDLLIFSPSMLTKPLCNQYPARGACPVWHSLWKISASWWGKRKSCPPPCMSNEVPKWSRLIALHSMCQPGRPSPHGDGQVGSPGLACFHKAKSLWSRFPLPVLSTRPPAPWRTASMDWPVNWPYFSGAESTWKYTPSLATYACPFSIKSSMIWIMESTYSVHRG